MVKKRGNPGSDKGANHRFGNAPLSYVQIPAVDVAESAKFYEDTFGWQVRRGSADHFSVTDAIGDMIRAWVTDLAASREPEMLL